MAEWVINLPQTTTSIYLLLLLQFTIQVAADLEDSFSHFAVPSALLACFRTYLTLLFFHMLCNQQICLLRNWEFLLPNGMDTHLTNLMKQWYNKLI